MGNDRDEEEGEQAGVKQAGEKAQVKGDVTKAKNEL